MTDASGAASASSSTRAHDSTPHEEQDREWPLLLRATDGRGKKDTKIKISTTVRIFCFSFSETSSLPGKLIASTPYFQLHRKIDRHGLYGLACRTHRSSPPTSSRSSRPTQPSCVRPSRADSDQRRRRATWPGNERSKRRSVKRPRRPQRELPSTRLRRPSSPVRESQLEEEEGPRTLRRGCPKWWDRGEGTGYRSEGG